jgi:hypothetical protein
MVTVQKLTANRNQPLTPLELTSTQKASAFIIQRLRNFFGINLLRKEQSTQTIYHRRDV